MKPEDPHLSDADLRAIADIRRELDAEFGPLPDASVPDEPVPEPVRDEPVPDEPLSDAHADLPRSRTSTRRRRRLTARSTRRGVIIAFVLGTLAGTGLGWLAAGVWHSRSPAETPHAARPATDPDGTTANPGTIAANPGTTAASPGTTAASPRTTAASPGTSASPAAAVDEVAALHDALDEWIAATVRGDIPAQMRFYPARVPVYYTRRDVPRDAVRAEKLKVFGGARTFTITTDTPKIELLDDHVTAVTRFRKRYVIEGPGVRRRGEVLQELHWMRTADGWLIVGERDARVIAAG